MRSHLLYTMITICIFAGIGSLINGLTKRYDKTGKSGPNLAVVLGIMLIAAGLLLLYLLGEELTAW